MSLAATNWAWGLKLNPTTKFVLLALADCHNGITGLCCPSVMHIMQVTGLKRRVVFKALSTLKKETLIEVKQSQGHCSKYVLTGNIPVHLMHWVVHQVHGGSAPHAHVIGNQPEVIVPPTPQGGNGRVTTPLIRPKNPTHAATAANADSELQELCTSTRNPPVPRTHLTSNNGHSTGLAGHFSRVSFRSGANGARNGKRAPKAVSERSGIPKSDPPEMY